VAIDKHQIITRLMGDYSMRNAGAFLRDGRCPACNKKSLFIETESPFNLKCGRENKCQNGNPWQMKTRELYPELFKPLHEQYPPTKENRNATADAYLLYQRGFNPEKLRTNNVPWFEQAQRVERHAVDEKGHTITASSETVRFYLDKDKTRWWEKFIQPIQMESGEKHTHFDGKRKDDGSKSIYKGDWWQAPIKYHFERDQEVYLVEGIFDAIALILAGKQAVALFSCYNFPEHSIKPHLGKNVRWVVALDNDIAGKKYAQRWRKRLFDMKEKVRICVAPDGEKKDWNDVYKEHAGKIPEKVFKDWDYQGELLAAFSALNKANIIHRHEGHIKPQFIFEFNNNLYHAAPTKEKGADDDVVMQIVNISNCYPEFLYYQKDVINRESIYFVRVTRADSGRKYQEEFKASHITSSSAFKQQLLDTGPGLFFTGSATQLDSYLKNFWFKNAYPAEVSAINFMGYSKEFKAWIFQKHCIYNGKLYELNNDDYFELGDQHIKTTFKPQEPIRLTDNNKPELWLEDFRLAYGLNGLTALAFWFGTLFAEQIRSAMGSWPFLEMSGVPGTGKTKLLEFLWMLVGRYDYEGIDLAKATHAGRWNTFSQLGNLPTVLIEGDRKNERGHQSSQFDLNEAKPLFNGRGMRAKATIRGNETIEPPFRSALVIAQNEQVDTDEAVMERIIHCHFSKATHSIEGKVASDRLSALDMDEISGFAVAACIKQHDVMESIKKHFKAYQQKFSEVLVTQAQKPLKNQRIRDNHAQLMACAAAMSDLNIVPLSMDDLERLYKHLVERAWKRHQSIKADHPLVQEFWEVYDYLESKANVPRRGAEGALISNVVNHHKKDNWIAINFPQFMSLAADNNLRINNASELKKLIKNSKYFRFDGYKPVESVINGKSTKCFVFERKKEIGK
jgi:hypothetical protein